jgi:hypothetical protein
VDRFTAAIVAGVLGLVIVSVAIAVLLRGREMAPDLGTPGGVALAYELALQRGDPEQAWDLLATSAKAATSRDQFLLRRAAAGALTIGRGSPSTLRRSLATPLESS